MKAGPAAAPVELRGGGAGRAVVAVLLGLAGSAAVWVATPFNNFVLRLGYISDSYLPIGALFVILVVVLVLNPCLRRWFPGVALNQAQVAIIAGMVLVASVLPGQGLLRMLPYSLARTCVRANGSAQLAEAYATADLPPVLFPDKLGYDLPAPTSERLLGELLPGEAIPWAAWLGPALAWGGLLLFLALMMTGLSMIVLPQWRHNERLAFPLLEVHGSLLAPPRPGHWIAPVFRRPGFWIGTGLVFGLYILYGANIYFPESVPAVPLDWDLQACFTEEPLRHLPWFIYRSRIYFLFVGVAFFMPTRISFSIWFMSIAYGIYIVVCRAYVPPYHPGTIVDHRSGAMLMVTVVVLWLGRRRWLQIARSLLRPAATPDACRDRWAGFAFLAGLGGMLGWFLWAGAHPVWAVVFVGIGFVVCLLIARLVAETGMPFIRIDGIKPIMFMQIVPKACPGPASVFLSGITYLLFTLGSRVNGTTMILHALALDDAKGAGRRQARLAVLCVGVLLIGFAACGGAHLVFSYNHSMTLDGVDSPISLWGTNILNGMQTLMVNSARGQIPRPVHSQATHLLFGAGLAGGLQWASMAMPGWPLHPIGLLMACTNYGNRSWSGVFLGWLLKILIIRYGGSRLYRQARSFFLGLIIGEVFAAVFWCILPAMLVLLGKPYIAVHIQPL